MSWQSIAALCVLCFTAGMVFAWALDIVEEARRGH